MSIHSLSLVSFCVPIGMVFDCFSRGYMRIHESCRVVYCVFEVCVALLGAGF